MRIIVMGAAMLCLAGCSGQDQASENTAANRTAPDISNAGAPADAEAGWVVDSDAAGSALALLGADGKPVVRLFCPSGNGRLQVNVAAFRSIASEERLSLGGDGEVLALVADTEGDSERGGVSAEGDRTASLTVILASPMSLTYGAQTSGPHPPPPANVARAFVAACGVAAPESVEAEQSPALPAPEGEAGPCSMQGSIRLAVQPRRAVGTEPFWGASTDGRCVTYTHPEDQAGTRVWTRYTKGANVEIWTGALGGQPFELRIQPRPGCSDGMSDRKYDYSAALLVRGERRSGCAETAQARRPAS